MIELRPVRAALLLAVVTVGFYWKLTLRPGFTFLDSPDLAYMVLPWYQFQARAWHAGGFPLWDPYQWCGQSLLGQMQPGAAFPLNWPLFWAPLENGGLNLTLFHWHYVAMHWLAAVFMYSYCRELGCSRIASGLAACGFSLGGFLGTAAWPQVMNGGLWMPLIFLFYHRAGRAGAPVARAANSAACGAAIGMALLAGHHQVQLFVLLALTGLFLYDWTTAPRKAARAAAFALSAVFAALVGGLILAPAWEYGSRSYRWVNLPAPLRHNETVPYIGHTPFAVSPRSLLGVVTPLEGAVANPFIGVVAASLAVLGVAACWATPLVRVHACLALAGLAFSMGAYSLLHGLLYAVVPLLDKARSPSQALVVFHFGLLVVAAHGLDALRAPSPWMRRLSRSLAVTAGLVLAITLAASATASPRGHSVLFTAAIALLLAVALHARFHAGAVVLLLAELGAGTGYMVRPRRNPQAPNYLDRLGQHREIMAFLHSQPGPFRVDADEQEIPHNFGDWEGLEAAGGLVRFSRPELVAHPVAAEPDVRSGAGEKAPRASGGLLRARRVESLPQPGRLPSGMAGRQGAGRAQPPRGGRSVALSRVRPASRNFSLQPPPGLGTLRPRRRRALRAPGHSPPGDDRGNQLPGHRRVCRPGLSGLASPRGRSTGPDPRRLRGAPRRVGSAGNPPPGAELPPWFGPPGSRSHPDRLGGLPAARRSGVAHEARLLVCAIMESYL